MRVPAGRWPARVGLVAALAAAAAAPASAQVGHEPGRSPFHDLTTRQALTFSVGWMSTGRPRPVSSTVRLSSGWIVTSIRSQNPASASSTELSTIS